MGLLFKSVEVCPCCGSESNLVENSFYVCSKCGNKKNIEVIVETPQTNETLKG